MAAAHLVRALTDAVRARRTELGAQFARRLRDVVPEYHAVDASDFQDAGWSALSVVIDGALDAVDDPATGRDLPPELLAESRAAARHDLSWTALSSSYQLTHRVLWEAVMAEAARARLRRDDELSLLQTASERLFDHFDRTTRLAGEAYEHARRQQRTQRESRTLHLVSQVLNGVAVRDDDLGYRLAQSHVALVAWGRDPRPALSAAGRALAAEVLVTSPGDGQWWAWLGLTADDLAELPALLDPLPDQGMALGSVRSGRAGFLASHQQARIAASLAARKLVVPDGGVVHYPAVALQAAGLDNETSARVFVDHVLGSLAEAGQRNADLRATVVAYSGTGLTAHGAARRLGVAERTVRYRLTRLEELLGTDWRERMPALVLAVGLHDALSVQSAARDLGAPADQSTEIRASNRSTSSS